MTRLFISLPDDAAEALAQIAYAELRDPRAQAALIIRKELARRGLLPVNSIATEHDQAQAAGVVNDFTR